MSVVSMSVVSVTYQTHMKMQWGGVSAMSCMSAVGVMCRNVMCMSLMSVMQQACMHVLR